TPPPAGSATRSEHKQRALRPPGAPQRPAGAYAASRSARSRCGLTRSGEGFVKGAVVRRFPFAIATYPPQSLVLGRGVGVVFRLPAFVWESLGGMVVGSPWRVGDVESAARVR